jgi:hypothetical protein
MSNLSKGLDIILGFAVLNLSRVADEKVLMRHGNVS